MAHRTQTKTSEKGGRMKTPMRGIYLGSSIGALLLGGHSALAGPTAPELQPGPAILDFDGAQQLTNVDGAEERAWGIIRVDSINDGTPDGDGGIDNGRQYWTDADEDAGGIRGIFYDLKPTDESEEEFASSGGRLDLYFHPDRKVISNFDSPEDRTENDSFEGVTDGGELLLSASFEPSGEDSDVTVGGDTRPTEDEDEFSGESQGYADADQEAEGLWADQFESFFDTSAGARDFLFESSYSGPRSEWTEGEGVTGSTIDSGTISTSVIPAPSSVLLMGLGLLGIGVLYGGLRHQGRAATERTA